MLEGSDGENERLRWVQGRIQLKREQRVKGTDLVMGEERRRAGAFLSARAPHNERLNFLWPGWHTKSTHPGSIERERAAEEGREQIAQRERREGEMETTG